MTDINNLPNGFDRPENRMTKAQQLEYFRAREQYDVDMSADEIDFWEDELIREYEKGDIKRCNQIVAKFPYDPDFALCIKNTEGLGSLVYVNLAWAKKAYPDEFQ